MKRLLSFFLILLISASAYAQPRGGSPSPKWLDLSDGDNGRPRTIAVSRDTAISFSSNGSVMSVDILGGVYTDQTYLRLDTTNDPLVNPLDIQTSGGGGSFFQLVDGASYILLVDGVSKLEIESGSLITITIEPGSITDTTGAITFDDEDLSTTGQVSFTGGKIINTTRVTTTYTVLASDEVVYGDTDGGAFKITLPTGVNGTYYRIVNVGTSGNTLTLSTDSAELLIGASTGLELSDSESIIIVQETTDGWY